MKASLSLSRDTLSPSLRRRAKALADPTPLLRTMGEYAVQRTKRSFNEPALRPAPWPALKSGGAAKLRKDQLLARSPRLVLVDRRRALVGSDRRYAAIHQLGGKTAARVIRPKRGKALAWPGARHPVAKVNHPGSTIPARPFFPWHRGRVSPDFRRALDGLVKTRLDQLLRT